MAAVAAMKKLTVTTLPIGDWNRFDRWVVKVGLTDAMRL